jgi:predicted nuclease of predicted toxin-antitoxin system
MEFKLDENLPVEAAELLRQAGHEAATVPEQQLTGRDDATVARTCALEKHALLTLDGDFPDIRAYPPAEYPGLVVMRLRSQDKRHVLETISRLIPVFSAEPLAGRLWIVEEERIRVRE